MNTLKLSELIGLEISDIRSYYVAENYWGVQEFHSYIKLADNIIITIPDFDEDDFPEVTVENVKSLQECFEKGEEIPNKANCVGQKIIDLLFIYYNDEIDLDHAAILKLSGGIYLIERNYGQYGTSNVGLRILNELQFETWMSQNKFDIHSFIEKKKL